VRTLKNRQEWTFFSVLTKASPGLGRLWWFVLVLRGVLPAAFIISMGVLISAVHGNQGLTGALVLVGILFVLSQSIGPINTAISYNLGDRLAAWLYDRLIEATVAPAGLGHLEDPELTSDLTMARDFDLGMTGPPLSISMDFLAGSLVQLVAGAASAVILFAFAWWAPIVLILAWSSTHWLLRESAIWQDRNTPEVRAAARESDYNYRMAVDPPAAKELRLFGMAEWTIQRFIARRKRLHELQYQATRLRERPLVWCLVIVVAANALVLWTIGSAAADGSIQIGQVTTFALATVGSSAIAFGGLNWALDGAAAPVAAVLRLSEPMAKRGYLTPGSVPATAMPDQAIVLRDVTFRYGPDMPAVLEHLNLEIPAGGSLAIVGQNGAGKTTLAKLLCRFYDVTEGGLYVDGHDLRNLDIDSWRRQIAAVFQDFTKFELSMRENVAPGGSEDAVVLGTLARSGAAQLADLNTVLARGYTGGIEISGGQWQRVALARALLAVAQGARLVILDEPTAQLDIRGEQEIFQRILDATKGCTTILVSHRFSTVRKADRICVLEHGRVVELGSHDELMTYGGRYSTMFSMQAERFGADVDEEGVPLDVLA
jgi:ATP-binding cassette subfamily B protein